MNKNKKVVRLYGPIYYGIVYCEGGDFALYTVQETPKGWNTLFKNRSWSTLENTYKQFFGQTQKAFEGRWEELLEWAYDNINDEECISELQMFGEEEEKKKKREVHGE